MIRSIILTAIVLTALASPMYAHEKGAVFVTPKSVAVGGTLGIRGEKLSKSTAFKLQLRGALETHVLAEVRTDTAGRFDARYTLPAAARAGSYTVVVLASDGDVSARADLTVSAAPTPSPTAMPDMAGMDHSRMPGMPDSTKPHATAEMMEVPVNTSGLEWAAIVAIVVLSAGGGLALLSASRTTQ